MRSRSRGFGGATTSETSLLRSPERGGVAKGFLVTPDSAGGSKRSYFKCLLKAMLFFPRVAARSLLLAWALAEEDEPREEADEN